MPPPTIAERFLPECVDILRRLIAENQGNEIFCVATLDGSGLVATVRVIARGNEHCVPAVLESVEFGRVAIHNHPSGQLVPSEADVNLAGDLGAMGVGSYIVDNEVARLHVLVEPFEHKQVQELQDDPIVGLFGPEGRLAERFAGFEYRPQQVRMVSDVIRAFNGKKIGLIEAGTGVGKSLAYLVPAVHWALANKQRIVVSTNTINLQEQLIHKDIPFLQQSLGLEFAAVLMKGRNNYLCLRRAADLRTEPGIMEDPKLAEEFQVLADWIARTEDGSLSDLSFQPSAELWDLICCEADSCGRARCPHFNRCFFFQARRLASKAQLIVTNHHLFMADMAIKEQSGRQSGGILPAFHKLILDEAHHLEEVATSYLGDHITPQAIFRSLGRLQSQRHADRGLIPNIGERLYRLMNRTNKHQVARIHKYIQEVFSPTRQECRDEVDALFQEMIQRFVQLERADLSSGEECKKRISPAVEATALWRDVIQPALAKVRSEVLKFVEATEKLLKLVYELDPDTLATLESPVLDAEAALLRLKTLAERLGAFQDSNENHCRWLEVRKRRDAFQSACCLAPLDVAERLRRLVFDSYESVVLTSATLAIGRSFNFIKGRVGLATLKPDRLVEDILDSPFDYANRVLLALPASLPEPTHPGFATGLTTWVGQSVEATDGGAFVLFTSYSLLRQVFEALEAPLREKGFNCLRQGQLNRFKLLEQFKLHPRSILFATDSFWEGVDVRGDALRCVIITRLPFQVPTEPIVVARLEKIEAEGGNPFLDYSVPLAVIKFKQGFGRLIRSHDDWGVVVICDRRVKTKSYGRQFLDSLPPCRHRLAGEVPLLDEMRRFRMRFEGRRPI